MATHTGSAEGARAHIEDPHLAGLVEQLEKPENQGIGLLPRDYVILGVATIILPILLTVWGMLAS